MRDLAFSVLIAVVLIVFIYQPVKVEGTSMMPTLTDQERIFINKFTYRFGLGSIERGDTVVFWYPQDVTKSYIKRVIGLPGDRVRVDGGQVFVNGRRWRRTMCRTSIATALPGATARSRWSRRTSISFWATTAALRTTAASGATCRAKNIYGKAVFVYWPLDKMGRVR